MIDRLKTSARQFRALVLCHFERLVMGNATKALNAVKALKPKAKKSLASVAGSIKPKNIDVRIMASRQGHQVNDVVTLPSDEADAACEAGWASKRAADVKYAASLPQNKI